MADDGLFVQVESPEKRRQHGTGFAGITFADQVDDPGDYQFNNAIGGVGAVDSPFTVVPASREEGAPKGKKHPYGKVVQGRQWVQDGNGGIAQQPWFPQHMVDEINRRSTDPGVSAAAKDRLRKTAMAKAQAAVPVTDTDQDALQGIVIPPPNSGFPDIDAGLPPERAARIKADAEVRDGKEMRDMLDKKAVNVQREAEAELAAMYATIGGDIMEEVVASVPIPGASASSTASVGTRMPPEPPPSLRVSLSGAFGKLVGMYRSIKVQTNQLVLTYDLEGNLFSPPPSAEPMTVTCGEEVYEVYFAGIEIELPEYGIGLQVMILSEDR